MLTNRVLNVILVVIIIQYLFFHFCVIPNIGCMLGQVNYLLLDIKN